MKKLLIILLAFVGFQSFSQEIVYDVKNNYNERFIYEITWKNSSKTELTLNIYSNQPKFKSEEKKWMVFEEANQEKSHLFISMDMKLTNEAQKPVGQPRIGPESDYVDSEWWYDAGYIPMNVDLTMKCGYIPVNGKNYVHSKNGEFKVTTYNGDMKSYFFENGVLVRTEEKFANGDQKSSTSYKNGILHGSHVAYYSNGKEKEKCSYSNGKLDQKYVSYFDNGITQREVTYKDGLKSGKEYVYEDKLDTLGNKLVIEEYTYENGICTYEIYRTYGFYFNEETNGFTDFAYCGDIVTYEYKNNKKHGKSERRDCATGNLKSSCNYNFGTKIGEEKFYDADGNLEYTSKLNKYGGETSRIVYYENGNVALETVPSEEYNKGVFKRYAEDGTLLFEAEYADGNVQNSITVKLGNQEVELPYKDGKVHGTITFTTSEGNKYEAEVSEGFTKVVTLIKPNGKRKVMSTGLYASFTSHLQGLAKEDWEQVLSELIQINKSFIKAAEKTGHIW